MKSHSSGPRFAWAQLAAMPMVLKAVFAALIIFHSGCSVLVGNVKPVEEKTTDPFWTDLTVIDPDFVRLSQSEGNGEENELYKPDSAWQSQSTAAIVAINSACRTGDTDSDPLEVTDNFLANWQKMKNKNQKEIIISGHRGLDTSGEGIFLDRNRAFRMIVVKSATCLYDISLLSPVKQLPKHLPSFEHFIKSLRLR